MMGHGARHCSSRQSPVAIVKHPLTLCDRLVTARLEQGDELRLDRRRLFATDGEHLDGGRRGDAPIAGERLERRQARAARRVQEREAGVFLRAVLLRRDFEDLLYEQGLRVALDEGALAWCALGAVRRKDGFTELAEHVVRDHLGFRRVSHVDGS